MFDKLSKEIGVPEGNYFFIKNRSNKNNCFDVGLIPNRIGQL